LIKGKPVFSGKIFWTLEIPFKTGFTVLIYFFLGQKEMQNMHVHLYSLIFADPVMLHIKLSVKIYFTSFSRPSSLSCLDSLKKGKIRFYS
jgi:hypothetical protein